MRFLLILLLYVIYVPNAQKGLVYRVDAIEFIHNCVVFNDDGKKTFVCGDFTIVKEVE